MTEFPPPLLGLYGMSESMLAGPTAQQREAHREIFIDKLEEILENSDYKDDVTMLRYNGSLSKLIFHSCISLIHIKYLKILIIAFHIYLHVIYALTGVIRQIC